jgi:S-adenosylmethionine:tRNA ribosyltransferase-isomerase
MEEHEMHAEWMEVSRAFIENLNSSLDGNIIAVGTTSLRTVESLYWLGVKAVSGGLRVTSMEITQWEVYERKEKEIPAKKALSALLEWMTANRMERIITRTQILIAPGYTFRIIKGLITNFHQPQSTLLLLVAALIGEDWRKVYDYAMKNEFRFLSYGDGSLLWKVGG